MIQKISNGVKKIKPEWPLRLGLGLMYLYSGYDIFYHPDGWVWVIPQWFSQIVSLVIPVTAYLRFQGVAEFIMGLIFIAGWGWKRGVRIAAILATLEMTGILLFSGINSITFRDIGLLGAVIALVIILFKEGEETI